MAGPHRDTQKTAIFTTLLMCVLALTHASSPSGSEECTEKVRKCQCLYGMDGAIDISNADSEHDPRTVGLAAATGVLSGVLATGTALAAYFHFRGKNGCGSGPGRGGVGHGRRGGKPSPRLNSTDSSTSSHGSGSPLTKRDTGDKHQSRFWPVTESGTGSSSTNIYRHSRVWPGHS